jgi:hypothetical protein
LFTGDDANRCTANANQCACGAATHRSTITHHRTNSTTDAGARTHGDTKTRAHGNAERPA